MKIENINVAETIQRTKEVLENDKSLAPELKTLVTVLLTLLEVLLTRLNKNSSNSSIPPSQDPNRQKTRSTGEVKRKPGGQPGRIGKTLKPVEDPDEIIEVPVDRKTLPSGRVYTSVGFTKRQVVELHLSRHVKEYRLEIVEDEKGKRFTANGPYGTSRPIQYGASLKATASYMSIYQLIPYGRVEEYFRDQADIPISVGTLFNFNKEAFDLLEGFENIAKEKLRDSPFLHSDETSINVNGDRLWLHGALNEEESTKYRKRYRDVLKIGDGSALAHQEYQIFQKNVAESRNQRSGTFSSD